MSRTWGNSLSPWSGQRGGAETVRNWAATRPLQPSPAPSSRKGRWRTGAVPLPPWRKKRPEYGKCPRFLSFGPAAPAPGQAVRAILRQAPLNQAQRAWLPGSPAFGEFPGCLALWRPRLPASREFPGSQLLWRPCTPAPGPQGSTPVPSYSGAYGSPGANARKRRLHVTEPGGRRGGNSRSPPAPRLTGTMPFGAVSARPGCTGRCVGGPEREGPRLRARRQAKGAGNDALSGVRATTAVLGLSAAGIRPPHGFKASRTPRNGARRPLPARTGSRGMPGPSTSGARGRPCQRRPGPLWR